MEFVARVAEPTGVVTEKTFTAESETALRQELDARGLHVFRLRPKRMLGLFAGLSGGQAVEEQEFLNFNQELVALVHAGLPILQCLSLLAERRKNLRFRSILQDVHSKVKAGSSLSDAIVSHGLAFPSVYGPTVMAGERSGELEGVLRRYVAYAQVMGAVKRKVRAALVYPAVLVVLSLTLVGILVTFVIPKFAGFYADFDAKLPWITTVLITIAEFASAHYGSILAAVVLGSVGFRVAALNQGVQSMRDRVLLRVPLAGEVMLKHSVSQFCRTLSTLLGGGLPLMTSLPVAAGAIGNAFVRTRIVSVGDKVREGGSLSDALDRTGLWTDTTLQMVRVGESAGALEEMLANVADFYDGEVERKVQTFVTLLEPALLVVMGVVIAGMLLAMYYPLFTLIQVVR